MQFLTVLRRLSGLAPYENALYHQSHTTPQDVGYRDGRAHAEIVANL
jgi:hypothetical protein